MKQIRTCFLILVTLLSFAACNHKEERAAAPRWRVAATKAFEGYFGPAPVTNAGSCFAFVIYFPSATAPGKVVPFPFFSFDRTTVKKVALERLMSGMDVGSYKGEFLPPFPPGARLRSVTEKDGVYSVAYAGASGMPPERLAVARQAVALTLGQFGDVKGVRIMLADDESAAVETARPDAVLPPGEPRLLSVSAVRGKGAAHVDEVNALFDRPVDIKELQMSDAAGAPFPGEVYQSVFDMAAVLKPKDASPFTAGKQVKVRWKVVDKKGRGAQGEGGYPLVVQEH